MMGLSLAGVMFSRDFRINLVGYCSHGRTFPV